MDIINISIDRTRRKLWLYGSIALALIVGLTLLVGANRVSAHGTNGTLAQSTEGDAPTLHLHASGGSDWAVYRSGRTITACDAVNESSYRDDFDPLPYASYISGVDLTASEITLYLKTAADDDSFCVRTGTSTGGYQYYGPVKVDLDPPEVSSIDESENNRMEVTIEKDDSFTSLSFSDNATTNSIRFAYVDGASMCDSEASWEAPADGTNYSIVSGALADIATTDLVFWVSAPYEKDGEYLCIAVADNVGNVDYASMMIDVSFNLTFKQMKDSDGDWVVRVSSTESGVTFTPPSVSEATQEIVCDFTTHANALNPRSIYKSPQSYEYVHADSNGGAVDNSVCVVAQDSKGNKIRTAFEIDRLGPEVNGVHQNNHLVEVFAVDQDEAHATHTGNDGDPIDNRGELTWHSVYVDVVANSDEADPDIEAVVAEACSEVNYNTDNRSENFITYNTNDKDNVVDLSGSRYREYYDGICFRVGDVSEQYAYSTGFVLMDFDSSGPIIVASKGSKPNTIELTLENYSGTESVTWNWDRELAIDDQCDADANFDAEQSATGLIEAEEGDTNYCVRATVGSENYYAFVKGLDEIDNDAPVVEIDEVNGTFEASTEAEDVNPDSWQYVVLEDIDAAQDNCDDTEITSIPDADWMDGSSLMPTAAHSNKAVCFRVADETGNYGYAYEALPEVDDSTPPTLTVTQSGNTLSWNAQDDAGIDTYSYQMSETTLDCMTDSNWMDGQKTALAESDNGMYYCFRVLDYGENAAYSGPLMVDGVDTTAPTITVSQTGNTVNAIPGELETSGWQFYRSDSEPADCSSRYTGWSDVKMVEEGRQVTGLMVDDSGKWICFRVMDAAGNYGYKKFQIETITADQEESRTASDGQLQFSLEGNRLMVNLGPAEGETEAPEVISWSYLYWSTENLARSYCTAERNQFDRSNRGTTNEFNVADRHLGKWFCFRAIDEDNEEAFGVFQVPGEITDAPIVVVPPTTGDDQDGATQQPPTVDPTDGQTDQTDTTGDEGTDTGDEADTGDEGETGDEGTDAGDEADTSDDADDADDGTDEEGGFLSDYLWYIIGAVVVVVLIVVFVAMGSKGNQRE